MQVSCPPSLSDRFVESFQYLNKHCPKRSEYEKAINQIVDLSLQKENVENPPHKLAKHWAHLSEIAPKDSTKGLPPLGLRLIQLLHFGSCKGWLSEDLLLKMMTIAINTGLLAKNKAHASWIKARKDSKPLKWLFVGVLYEVQRCIPYNPNRYKYIFDKYCKKHLEVLSKLTPKQIRLSPTTLQTYAPKPKKTTSPSADERALSRTFNQAKVSNFLETHLLKTFRSGSLSLIVKDLCNHISSFINTPNLSKKNSEIDPFSAEFSLSADEKFVHMLLFNKNNLLAIGSTIRAFKAQQFVIPLDDIQNQDPQYHREVVLKLVREPRKKEQSPKPIQENQSDSNNDFVQSDWESDSETEFEGDCATFADTHNITESIESHAPELADKLNERRFFEKSTNFYKFNQPPPLKAVEPWLNCTLHYAVKERVIPLDFTRKPPTSQPITVQDLVRCFIEIAEYLQKIHKIGIIHRDIKTTNILLKLPSFGPIETYLSDWGGARGNCLKKIPFEDYILWDSLGKYGLSTIFTDWYAFVISLAAALLPNFNYQLSLSNFKEHGKNELASTACKSLIKRLLATDVYFEMKAASSQPNDLQTLCEFLTNFVQTSKMISNDDQELISNIAIEARAAQLALTMLEDALEMDQAVVKALTPKEDPSTLSEEAETTFSDEAEAIIVKEAKPLLSEEAETIFTQGCLADRLEYIERIKEQIPFVNEIPARLHAIDTELDAFAKELASICVAKRF